MLRQARIAVALIRSGGIGHTVLGICSLIVAMPVAVLGVVVVDSFLKG